MPDHDHVNNGSKIPTGAAVRPGGLVRRWIEAVFLAAGVVLLAAFATAQLERLITSKALLEGFPATTPSTVVAPASALPEDRSVGSNSGTAIADESGRATSVAAAVDTVGVPLAILRIPRIHLEVPVLDGTDALTLNHAAGRITGTARPGQGGNIGIAAHRDSFFRNLGKLHVGDPIELESPDGVQTYIVEQTQIVMPNNLSVLAPRPEPSLTLVTCYPFHYLGRAPQRYIVTASLEPGAPIHPPGPAQH